jgi:DNA repair protein RecO (recombination protein O)
MSDGGAELRIGAAGGRQRVQNEASFVLHTHPWKETSLVVDLFTRSHGRISAVAKGARRPHSQLRALLMPFQPVLATWSGRSELRLIQSVEWRGGIPQLGGVALMCGFYLNELLRSALAREDPHEALFDAYAHAVGRLRWPARTPPCCASSNARSSQNSAMRCSSKPRPTRAKPCSRRHGTAIFPIAWPQRLADDQDAEAFAVRGKTLLDMGRDDYGDPVTAAESKRLMRSLLGAYLGHAELHTRQLLKDLQQL